MNTNTQNEINCFGCTKAAIDAAIAKGLGHPMMLAMSMMSDAQELLERGLLEEARQVLNRAKYVVSEVGFKDLDAPAPKPLALTPMQKAQATIALNQHARWLRSQSALATSLKDSAAEDRYDAQAEATMAVLAKVSA